MAPPFAHWVSLGFNCEVAFQFRRVLGHDSSSFFSWNITDFQALKALLDNRFSGILEAGNLSDHGDGVLVRDASHGFSVHTPFSTPDPHADPDFEAHLAGFREKVGYLLRKFETVAASGDAVAYFYRTDEPNAWQKAQGIVESLRRYHTNNDNFVLVVLQPQEREEADWGIPHLANRYLRRLAPWNDATDGHVQSWDRVFSEFPHREEMRLAGF